MNSNYKDLIARLRMLGLGASDEAADAIQSLTSKPAGVGCPCEPMGLDGERCPGPDGRPLCAAPAPSDELAKFKEHSVLLNKVIWKMAEALGLVSETDEQAEVNPSDLIDQYFNTIGAPAKPDSEGAVRAAESRRTASPEANAAADAFIREAATEDTERAKLIERLRNQAEGWNDEGASGLTVLMNDAIAYIESNPPVDAAEVRDRVMGELEEWFDVTNVDIGAATDSVIAAITAQHKERS